MTDLSVLLPIYNASRYPPGWVERAVYSVLDQPDLDAEVCIGDDGSTDKFLKRFKKNTRVKIAHNENGPTGGAEAVNCAAEAASGRYFIILSCRSWYEERALTAMARYLDEHPKIGFCYGSSTMHYPNGRMLFKHPPAYSPDQWRHLFPWSFGYMYRRDAWDAGCRYGLTVQTPDGPQTIADHDFIMQLIHTMKYTGFVMQGLMVLHYEYGGVTQNNDFLAKYKGQLRAAFEDRWKGV